MSSKKQIDATGIEPKSKQDDHPKQWWQWLLLYPGLAIALLGSLPTLTEAIDSHRLGVAFGRSADAHEQNRLWQENFECAAKAAIPTITTRGRVEIGSTVCESGDVLLRGKRPEWDKAQLRWVSWSEVASGETAPKNRTALFDLFPAAHAAQSVHASQTQPTGSVMCQRWIGSGLLLQRIATHAGCFDQTVNTYKGWVVSSRPAPCNPAC